jgi:hypothetical protein
LGIINAIGGAPAIFCLLIVFKVPLGFSIYQGGFNK